MTKTELEDAYLIETGLKEFNFNNNNNYTRFLEAKLWDMPSPEPEEPEPKLRMIRFNKKGEIKK